MVVMGRGWLSLQGDEQVLELHSGDGLDPVKVLNATKFTPSSVPPPLQLSSLCRGPTSDRKRGERTQRQGQGRCFLETRVVLNDGRGVNPDTSNAQRW